MAAPRLTVIFPTYRVGGFDVALDSLAGQTFRDFELIVVDAIWARRNPIIRDRFSAYPFPIKHLAPSGGMALSNYSRSINDGIAHASGELIVIQADYTWMPPNCLETHWRAYEQSDKRSCFMLDNHCTELPPLNPDFPGYGPNFESKEYSEAERPRFESDTNHAASVYERDVMTGRLDSCMWSLFREPLTNEKVLALPVTRSHCKQGQPLDPNWCSLKNEGIPTEAFLAVNGLDEDMDGSHLYQDQEFAWRVAKAGYRWTTAAGGSAFLVNPRSLFYSKRLSRPMMTNGDIMRRKQASGERVNPHRFLRAEREASVAT